MSAPTIRVLQTGDETVLESFLLPRLETSMFLVGNVRSSGLCDRGRPYEGTCVAAFEGDQIVGVVTHFWNGNLVLQAPAHLDALWREAVKASNRAIKGIIGPADQVGAVKGELDIRPLAIQKDETEKLYSLNLNDLIVPDRLRSGLLRGRRIEARDLELVTEWRVRFSIEALGDEDGTDLRDHACTDMKRKLDEGLTWILEDGDVPVACSSFNTAIREAVQIGGVWTPPRLRGRGYGRAVVAASLLDARAEGVEMSILFTGQDNVSAQRAYEAIGFKHVGEYHILLLRDGAC